MSNKTLPINLTSGSSAGDEEAISLTLEQEDTSADKVRMRDIYDMWIAARSGLSARNIKPYLCDLKIGERDVTFTIAFFVWTLPIDLPYELSTNLGTIDSGAFFERERDFSALFELSDRVAIDKKFRRVEYEWLTPVFDRFGAQVTPPRITSRQSSLEIPDSYFGEARVKLVEQGNRHLVTVTIATADDEGNTIQVENVDIAVTATWANSDGDQETTELDLEISECIQSALSMCKGRPSIVCQSCEELIPEVYYSVCDGSVIFVRMVNIGESGSWCLPAVSGR